VPRTRKIVTEVLTDLLATVPRQSAAKGRHRHGIGGGLAGSISSGYLRLCDPPGSGSNDLEMTRYVNALPPPRTIRLKVSLLSFGSWSVSVTR